MTQQRPPGFSPGKPKKRPAEGHRNDRQTAERRHPGGAEPRQIQPPPGRLSLPREDQARRGESSAAAGRQTQGRPSRPSAAPPGTVWLYGIHAVAAALANPARRLRRLLVTEEAEPALAAEVAQPWPIPPESVSRERVDQLLAAGPGSGVVHQGIALLADQLAFLPLAEALKRPGPVLVLDQISDPRNIGALLRTARAFGAAMVIAQDRNAPEETGALAKAASGALELIPLLRVVNIARALIVLKAAGLWVVGLDGASPGRLRGAAFAGRRVALVLGSEGEGMRRLTRESCDETAALAMPGGMESLNVAAAGAVALYELTRPGD